MRNGDSAHHGNSLEVSGDAATPTPPAPPAPALGRAVGGGMTWTVGSLILSKLSSTVAQVILGWFLMPEHFGLFAMAAAAAGFVNVLRDGGAGTLLTQRGTKEYEQLSGPLFWMGLTANTISGAVMAIGAFPLARYVYKDQQLVPMLLVMALAVPLSTPAATLQAKMRCDLRFKTMSQQAVLSATVRQASMVVLAWLGFGAMSFAIPSVIVAVFDSAMAWWVTKDQPWRRSPQFSRWPGLLSSGKWVVAGMFANASLDLGPYLIAGAVFVRVLGSQRGKEELGVFYFAFQITAQMGVLLGTSLQHILMPILARLNDESERQRAAIVRSLHALMILGSFSCILLAVAMSPVEYILWRGKWSPAVIPVVILGLFFPWRITFGLTSSALQAQGRFKRLSFLTWMEGLGLMGATAAGCFLTPTPIGLAWWTGGWLLIARATITAYSLHMAGTTVGQIIRAMFPSWLVTVLAGAGTLGSDHYLRVGPALRGLAHKMTTTNAGLVAAEVVRAGLLCTVFVGMFVVLIRLLLKHHLQDAVSVAPVRLRRPLQSLLRLGG